MVTILTTTLIVTFALTLFFGGFYLKDIKGLWVSGIATGLLIIFGTLILSVSPITTNITTDREYIYGNNFTGNNSEHWDYEIDTLPQNVDKEVFLFHVLEEEEYTPISEILNYVLGIIFLLLGLGGLFQISETYNTMRFDKSEED